MQLVALLLVALGAVGSRAAYPPSPPYMLRFSCGELVVERLDPLVSRSIPSHRN